MSETTALVDLDRLRAEVQAKYREVAEDPAGDYHFPTGRCPRPTARLPRLAA
jgi:hypothetical protein